MATITKEMEMQPSSSVATSSEDESLKRNTDCVYFLASPLTCKKGSECEYRHSEFARLNPRDCWYWMNGTCLNPKCSFRHPPLEGVVGPQVGNFLGPPIPAATAPHVPMASSNAPKQAALCIFFQKGLCLKGDRCPFSHGPNPPNMKIQQSPAPSPATEPSPFKKTFGAFEKNIQPKVNVQANASKPNEVSGRVNAVPKVEVSHPRNGVPAGRRAPPPNTLVEEFPRFKETVAPIDNGHVKSRISRMHHGSLLDDQSFQNGRDADESLRESSPGFDVLVDDKLEDDEYYQNEDQYVRLRAHDGRSLNEFELNCHVDYDSMIDADSELYHNRRGYDSSDRMQERYAWEQHHRTSSERSLGEPPHYDRRVRNKSESPDLIPNSDLRQRLSKHKRVNGMKSVVNRDYGRDKHGDDRGYRSSRKDARHSPTHETTRVSRLQGRIKLPRVSPPVSGGNMYSEREHDRERNWPQGSSQQGRFRDRLSGRVHDDINESKISRGPVGMRRDFNKDNNGFDFAPPKRLAELKGSKQVDTKQPQPIGQPTVSKGKLKDTVLAGPAGSQSQTTDLSFEGPRPLSEILKRKRNAGTVVSSGNKEIKKNDNNEDLINNTKPAVDTEKQIGHSSEPEQEQAGEEENKLVGVEEREEDSETFNKKIKVTESETSVPIEEKQLDNEEGGLKATEGKEEQEHDEEYDHGDGEYDYEQDEGEGYDLNVGETEDFMEEEDGDDDFAKKLGVSI